MENQPISAVIITFNEEKNIGRCIDSLHGIADEIVVLDSGSTDGTAQICQERGVVFHTHPFDDYAAQKNRATNLASHDLILSLDADEALSEPLKVSLAMARHNGFGQAYTMNRLTSYCGHWVRHCGWYPDTKLRMYDRRKGRWTGRKIHERITMDADVKIHHLEGDLLHYSFYSIAQHMDTVNKFSSLKAELLFEKGKNSSVLQLSLSPGFKFFQIFILKGGFRDGSAGLHIAANSAHGAYLKHAKLRELWQKSKPNRA